MNALDNVHDTALRAEFENHVESIYRQAYAEQGRKALEYPRHSTAIHEAGHAIVYAATELEATLIYALRLVAGVTAEMLFDGRDFRQGSSADELVMVGALARNLEQHHWHQPAEYGMALVMATATKLLRSHAGTVATLAATLERQRKIQGQDLIRLIRSVQRVSLPASFNSLSRWQP